MQCCECFPGADLSPFLEKNLDTSLAHKPGMAEHPMWARAFLSLAAIVSRVSQKNPTPEEILSPHSFTDCLDD